MTDSTTESDSDAGNVDEISDDGNIGPSNGSLFVPQDIVSDDTDDTGRHGGRNIEKQVFTETSQLRPRAYQLEMLDKSMERNIIVAVG
jgi:hypothetical protein